MRRLAPLFVVLLVLTAGCANFLPWSGSHSTQESTTTSHAALSPPPGANDQWIFDAKRLVDAHEAALDGSNYRMRVRVRPNESYLSPEWGNTNLTAHVGGGHALLRGEGGGWAETDLSSRSYRIYSSNETTAMCFEDDDQCQYYSGEPTQYQRVPKRVTSRMQSILASSDFVSNGTTVRNGTRLYRYEADGQTTLTNVSTLSATVLVDEDGLIHDLSGTVQTTDELPVTAQFHFGFAVVSDPPSEPKWMDSLPRVAVRVNQSEFTIEHEGGAKIPAGTKVRLSLRNDPASASGTVRLPKSLARGDVAHLTITGLEDASRQYEAVGNVTVNRPATGEPEIDHTNWALTFGFETRDWFVTIWANRDARSHKTTDNSTETTTTVEV